MVSKKSKAEAIEKYNEGVVHYNKKDYTKAITNFRGALDNDPKNEQFAIALANCYNNRGVAKYEAKQYEKAINDFEKALEYDPENAQYDENLSLAEEELKKIELDELFASAYESYNQKKYEKAIKHLQEALKIDEENKDFMHALAVAYNGRGVQHFEDEKYDAAMKDFEKAMDLWPDDRQFEQNLQWTKEAKEIKG